MRFFKLSILAVIFCLIATMPTGGQSLVMSGNEVFEQEGIPKKSKSKDKDVQQKSLKQKGTINVPVLKTDKPNSQNNIKDPKIIEKGAEKKSKVSTLSLAENSDEENQVSPIFLIAVQVILFFMRNIN
ncbi:MAG: hypothetical protein MUC49_17530 [Raineya sp.]|nr:hypothetical protein [Raineya sp.]